MIKDKHSTTICLEITPKFLSLSVRNLLTLTMTLPKGLYNVYRFYADGFRNMTLGKTLWAIILIKIFIMFAILRLIFFPNPFSHMDSNREKGEYVRSNFIEIKP